MTAITLTNDLPSELVTLEKLAYHASLAMNISLLEPTDPAQRGEPTVQ